MEKFCPNCGKEVLEGADYCLSCGKRIISTAKNNRGFDKNLMIPLVVGIVGMIAITLFWIIVPILAEIDSDEEYTNSSRKYCCIEAGGHWSDDRCKTGYWFDEDEYEDCINHSF